MRNLRQPLPDENDIQAWAETFSRELKDFDPADIRFLYVTAWAHGHIQATKESVTRLWGHQ